jgi:hypothetical protein
MEEYFVRRASCVVRRASCVVRRASCVVRRALFQSMNVVPSFLMNETNPFDGFDGADPGCSVLMGRILNADAEWRWCPSFVKNKRRGVSPAIGENQMAKNLK